MINVAILGYGTVGSGVAGVIANHSGAIAAKVATPIHIKYILVRRDMPEGPFSDLFVKDFSVIEQDPEVQVVVETMGGTGAALEYTRRALLAGKNVVTSNKELVAEHGYELLQLARSNNLSYLFEASVGGGIPIIRPISQCLAANDLTEICGILNGTTNYILTRMIRAGLSFEEALQEAQEKGYAERDPAADVEGHDACRKICILASLSFGRHIYPSQADTEGITKITLEDVQYAEDGGKKIKLLGRAMRQPDGKVCAYVAPHLVDEESPLANVEDVFNGIVVKGDSIGEVMFYGRGAGKLPTASAVVADIMDAARHIESKKYINWAPGGADAAVSSEGVVTGWYVRADAQPSDVEKAFGDVAFLHRSGAPEEEKAFLTAPMTREEVEQRSAKLGVKSLIRVLGQ
ncbi:MAG: homoserine dehydrogenase [Oscillospiraceae bacterium]|nr:homoserine dehydrogenase [Oscillospiraceae bacterium]